MSDSLLQYYTCVSVVSRSSRTEVKHSPDEARALYIDSPTIRPMAASVIVPGMHVEDGFPSLFGFRQDQILPTYPREPLWGHDGIEVLLRVE
jgi:hypothetical protein